MAFEVPSFRAVLDDLVADFANRFPGANVSRLSGHWKRLAVIAGAVASLLRYIQVVARDVMPDTAAGSALDRWLVIYGLTRKPATAASKADALRLTGTVGAAFTSGAELTTVDGLEFALDESGVIPAAGYVDVDVIAVSTGVATRKSAGTVLTFGTPPSGIDSNGVLMVDMDVNGSDIETDGAARVRLLDAIAAPSMGGNGNDYRQWAKELTNVDEAYVWPIRAGLGSVHVAALRSGRGDARLLSGDERDELEEHIDAKRPVGYAAFAVVEVVTEPTDVEMLIEPEEDPVYAFHWDDSTPPTVDSYDAGTRLLTFSVRPDDLGAGDRLTWDRASGGTGAEATVEALSGADAVVLKAPATGDEDWTIGPPVVGNTIYAGGPLVTSVRAAILAHIDGLGPGRVDTDSGLDHSYGSSYWEGTLRLSKLHNLAQKQSGVLDSEVLDPAVNVDPTNAAPALEVALITPGQILVRKKW